jgi:hypothetical protein
MKSVPQQKPTQNIPSERILELRQKIHDNVYLENAVQRIAFVMSRQLVDNVSTGRK